MSSPTRRDEAWHAALVTATETGVVDSFGTDEVLSAAAEMNVDVSYRTIHKTLQVMVDFGYLTEIEPGEFQLEKDVVAAVTAQRALPEVSNREP